ncbi:VWA domain-containing protein [Sphaerisporangium album]|uniref:VWA domain-containing protein n=1 Tax=Sphaerisporangium album TaxID=509200 RepID=A0A367FQG0_9ACTN|nr:vWA domain-containing protein [Sphaerisporangium album]RCG31947.1 VWA domain-containing protein [Sphaerisporangium album]
MTSHIAPTTATPTTISDPAWLRLSAALTWETPVIADRDDLIVTIAPGAGHGAPACFLPTQARIELDGEHLKIHPGSATPDRASDRTRYPAVWGMLTHECAHAKHSVWETPTGTPADVAAAAELLEEARIEAAQIGRRPDDRHWLRASAREIVLADTHAGDPTKAPAMTPHAAAHTAALLLGRADGGILTRSETAPVARAVRGILGDRTLRKLRKIWREALTVADGDAAAMIELGRRWVDILGPDPAANPPASAAGASGAPAGPSPLADAINTTLGKVDRAVARQMPSASPAQRPTPASGTPSSDPAEEATARVADAVFGGGSTTGTAAPLGNTRAPEPAEAAAARALARALSTAGIRDRVTTKTTSPIPPGRLRMRGVIAREAQRAAGRIPTAEPFARTTRKVAPVPPLRIGIACDVSGSMSAFTGPVASAAWILAQAARHTSVPTETATVTFGNQVRAITRPGVAPAKVTEFTAPDSSHAIDTAIDALDGALGLARPGAARLLVIVSDGRYEADRRMGGQKRLDRLQASGCAVLWLATGGKDEPMKGATVHVLADPAATATAIGRAATAALRAAR